jgi:hypothetical protein
MPPISTKQTTSSYLKSFNTKAKTMTYDVGNPSPGLEQALKCDRVQAVNGISINPPLIISVFLYLHFS